MQEKTTPASRLATLQVGLHEVGVLVTRLATLAIRIIPSERGGKEDEQPNARSVGQTQESGKVFGRKPKVDIDIELHRTGRGVQDR
eukprot:3888135-Amphidinium_carterae.1